LILTKGQILAYKAIDYLMMLPVLHPKAMLADQGNDSDCSLQALVIHAILPVVPSRKGRKKLSQIF